MLINAPGGGFFHGTLIYSRYYLLSRCLLLAISSAPSLLLGEFSHVNAILLGFIDV